MSGKEHVTVGTTATVIMAAAFIFTEMITGITFLIPLIVGGVIGSYMPDIDSQKSKAAQTFNKILMVLIMAMAVSYSIGLMINVSDIMGLIKANAKNMQGVILFAFTAILGKLSPHRMFTHKWLGTLMFCCSSFLMGNKFFAIGFTMGYILHIVCDRISKNGKYLRFYQFKLPCKNAKNKTVISW